MKQTPHGLKSADEFLLEYLSTLHGSGTVNFTGDWRMNRINLQLDSNKDRTVSELFKAEHLFPSMSQFSFRQHEGKTLPVIVTRVTAGKKANPLDPRLIIHIHGLLGIVPTYDKDLFFMSTRLSEYPVDRMFFAEYQRRWRHEEAATALKRAQKRLKKCEAQDSYMSDSEIGAVSNG